MSVSKNIIGNIVLGVFILFSIVIMYQHKYRYFEVKKLKGSFIEIEKPKLNWSNWISGAYQKQKTKYIKEKFGFRNSFVRVHNQVAYSFFSKAKANGVIVGKEGYLYELQYIKSYYGTNFVGKDSIVNHVNRIKAITDTLNKLGKELIVVIAPGKGCFYPEFIPEKYHQENPVTNYEVYYKNLQMNRIKAIDFNKWFVENKNKSQYPLYPKTGIHWSVYGETFAMDSIVRFIEKHKGKSMVTADLNVQFEDTLQYTDNDIERGMNLFYDINNFKMAYPKQIKFYEEGKYKPNLLMLADSFFWGVYGRGIAGRYFSKIQFWYYNKKVHESGFNERDASAIDMAKAIDQTDYIILLSTEANLHRLNYGFIERLYKHFYK